MSFDFCLTALHLKQIVAVQDNITTTMPTAKSERGKAGSSAFLHQISSVENPSFDFTKRRILPGCTKNGKRENKKRVP